METKKGENEVSEEKSVDEILDRIHAKKEAKAARKAAEADEDKEKQKLVVERTPSGLYYVKNERSGVVPAPMRGLFTSIDKIKTLAFMHNREIAE